MDGGILILEEISHIGIEMCDRRIKVITQNNFVLTLLSAPDKWTTSAKCPPRSIITVSHFSIDQWRCFLHHWTLKCAFIFVKREIAKLVQYRPLILLSDHVLHRQSQSPKEEFLLTHFSTVSDPIYWRHTVFVTGVTTIYAPNHEPSSKVTCIFSSHHLMTIIKIITIIISFICTALNCTYYISPGS